MEGDVHKFGLSCWHHRPACGDPNAFGRDTILGMYEDNARVTCPGCRVALGLEPLPVLMGVKGMECDPDAPDDRWTAEPCWVCERVIGCQPWFSVPGGHKCHIECV